MIKDSMGFFMASLSLYTLFVFQAVDEMEDSPVYGGVEGGGTHSTAMIFNQVNSQSIN